jgi:hypothetical protein
MDDYCCRFNKDCYSMAALGLPSADATSWDTELHPLPQMQR